MLNLHAGKLAALKLSGMLKALEEQGQMSEVGALCFEERLGLLVDREWTERENRRVAGRLRKADCAKRPPWRTLTGAPARPGNPWSWLWQLPVDRPTSQLPDHRPHRRGQELAGLRPGHKACREGYSVLYCG